MIAAMGALSCLAACSSAPAPNVIIIKEVPVTGGATGAGGDPPISFASNGGGASPSSTGSAASGGGGAPSSPTGAAGDTAGGAAQSGLPCDVAAYLSQKCLSCHGAPPLPSALSSLVTLDDLMAPSKEDPTKSEAELSLSRMKNTASPMPPGAPPPASDVAILENWINAGYPMGSCGGSAGGDAGAIPPPPPSVFKDAPAFVSRTGQRTHNAGKDCMSCHATGGGEAPRFSFGGTLYDGSGNPVGGAEVRLVDANGKATSVYTSTSGTFYSGGAFAAPAHVGVRDAMHESDMLTALQASNGGCSSCHCTGSACTVAPIHLP